MFCRDNRLIYQLGFCHLMESDRTDLTHQDHIADIHRFELPGSVTHNQNVVREQTTPLSYRGIQPNFYQNKRSSVLYEFN